MGSESQRVPRFLEGPMDILDPRFGMLIPVRPNNGSCGPRDGMGLSSCHSQRPSKHDDFSIALGEGVESSLIRTQKGGHVGIVTAVVEGQFILKLQHRPDAIGSILWDAVAPRAIDLVTELVLTVSRAKLFIIVLLSYGIQTFHQGFLVARSIRCFPSFPRRDSWCSFFIGLGQGFFCLTASEGTRLLVLLTVTLIRLLELRICPNQTGGGGGRKCSVGKCSDGRCNLHVTSRGGTKQNKTKKAWLVV
mmetsp:Transcript_193/g.398  ORF Transcript_193/g.398 Transcript_193/m.398 type:complete len:248 (+) Transcript_193:439-1182(+)